MCNPRVETFVCKLKLQAGVDVPYLCVDPRWWFCEALLVRIMLSVHFEAKDTLHNNL